MGTPFARYDALALEGRRLQAIRWIQEGKKRRADIARELGVSRAAVSIWWSRYLAKGEAALRRRPRPGRPPKADPKTLARLPQLLHRGAMAYGFATDLWTTKRVAHVVEQEFGVHYHRDHVCRLLHTLGMSWQRPERQALERNEDVVQAWVRHRWLAIRKEPTSSTRPSSSRTSRRSP